ncbi:MAG: DUF4438 domain-containing protein [Planctomycetes bacterium]|nr:DUF4438 domain-containing protein [Planctomycetota bacterium]
MLKTNEDKLVMQSVLGEVSPPGGGRPPYRVGPDGKPNVLPGTGGITYNLRVGDGCVGLKADHVEPCVTTKSKDASANTGYNTLSGAGNEARVVSGDAKGAKGVVTGKHGGCEHVMIDFDDKTLDKLVIGDKVQIKAFGLGLELIDFPDVAVMNLSPRLLKAWPIKGTKKSGVLKVPVTHKIPGAIMGSGLGSSDCHTGDYDIQLFDKKIVAKHGLDTLRFGDLVAIMDTDHSFGRIYQTGAVSVGVVVHSDCVNAGHGPGVMTLLTSAKGKIDPVISRDANISTYLKIGRARRKRK